VQQRLHLGPISDRAVPYEEFFPGALATIALWKWARGSNNSLEPKSSTHVTTNVVDMLYII